MRRWITDKTWLGLEEALLEVRQRSIERLAVKGAEVKQANI